MKLVSKLSPWGTPIGARQRGLECRSNWPSGRALTGRRVVEGAVLAGERILPRAPGSQGNDRVGDAVEGAVEDAADGARVVDDAVGLAALDDGEAMNRPAIQHLARQRACR